MKRLTILLGLAAIWGVSTASAQPVDLAGPWKLQLDDNPRWAQPSVDDSAWPVVLLPQRTPRPEQSYWLRRTVTAPPANGPLEATIGLVSESYDVYANGDVSGKGLRAALPVSMIVGALRETPERRPSPLFQAPNHVAVGQTGLGFVTCCCTQFSADGVAVLANAGHIAPWCNGGEVTVEANLPLGITPDLTLEESTFLLRPSEQLTLVSDGVVEAANSKGELLGFDRTCDISRQSAQQIADAAKAWGQNDDITVVTSTRRKA